MVERGRSAGGAPDDLDAVEVDLDSTMSQDEAPSARARPPATVDLPGPPPLDPPAGVAALEVAPGTLLAGRYRIERLLARGGMGRVYLATQLPLDRRVAVKLLSPRAEVAWDPQFVQRFYLEAAVCARLAHPNVVTVHDYGEADGGVLFMAMEHLDGAPLSVELKRGPFEPERGIPLCIQICRALREAHGHNIIHRDLKPGNIMLLGRRDEDDLEVAKVLDFGLLKVFEPEGEGAPAPELDLTRAGMLLGSPRYMSPEQIRNEHLDPRTDIYSLGVIMYQMASGRTPFDGKTTIDVLHSHLHHTARALDGVFEPWAAIIARCLAKRREDRYPDIGAVLTDLKRALRQLAGTHSHSDAVSFIGRLEHRSGGVQSGSHEAPIAAAAPPRRPSSGRLEATAVAPLADPALVAGLELLGGAGLPPAHGGLTPLPLEDSQSSQVQRGSMVAARRSERRGRSLAGMGLLALFAIAGTFAFLRGGGQPEPARPPVAAPVAVEAPTPRVVHLTIESRPPGAEVSEGGAVLGRTPLTVRLDPEGSARHFELSLEGYASYRFRQPPAAADVRVLAQLVALADGPEVEVEPPAEPEARPARAKPARPRGQPGARGAPSAPEPGGDIRLSR